MEKGSLERGSDIKFNLSSVLCTLKTIKPVKYTTIRYLYSQTGRAKLPCAKVISVQEFVRALVVFYVSNAPDAFVCLGFR
jgi:hypothetical protein